MFKAVITNALKELIIPELDKIKADVSETKAVLNVTNKRIDDLSLHMVEVNRRIDETNNRLNRLYEVIVRREEHAALEQKIIALEREVHEIKIKMAG
jgi:predicted nuclease with TOPRIM domain